jgi:hypothetical protein
VAVGYKDENGKEKIGKRKVFEIGADDQLIGC